MSGKKERKLKMTSIRFDINNDDDRKALEFLKTFKHKQSDFLVSLLLWYSEHAEKFGLTFLPEEKKIIDLSNTNDFLESFGFSREESQKIIEKYSYDQLSNIRVFLKDIEKVKKDSEFSITPKSKDDRKNAKEAESDNEEELVKSQSKSEVFVERDEPEIPVKTTREKREALILESEDDEDDGDDDWMLGMAGMPSQN